MQCLHHKLQHHSHGLKGRVKACVVVRAADSNAVTQQRPGLPAVTPKRVVVVGGGWAGFGAAKHLSSQGYQVGQIDCLDGPGGMQCSAVKAMQGGMRPSAE